MSAGPEDGARNDEGRGDELREDEIPDVDVTTRVRAEELRFRIVPKVKLRFTGEPAVRSRSSTERDNLPDQVEPEATYRGAEVRWTAGAKILHPTDPPPHA